LENCHTAVYKIKMAKKVRSSSRACYRVPSIKSGFAQGEHVLHAEQRMPRA
jgi:hypothetical protein